MARIPIAQLQALGDLTRTPCRSLTQLLEIAAGMRSYAGSFEPTRTSSLVGGIGPHRRWTWVSVDLDDAKFIRHAFGGTVNDVIVTVVTSGLRQLLLHRGEPLDGLAVRSLIPVSIRSDEAHNLYDNEVTAMFAELPVAIDDPLERLAAVQEQMGMLKASHQADAGIGLAALSQFAPSAAIAFAERSVMRVLRHVPQHSIATVATNVPGPQHPLYLAGREMLEYSPVRSDRPRRTSRYRDRCRTTAGWRSESRATSTPLLTSTWWLTASRTRSPSSSRSRTVLTINGHRGADGRRNPRRKAPTKTGPKPLPRCLRHSAR